MGFSVFFLMDPTTTAASLSSNVNKQKGQDRTAETREGVASEKLPELTLKMKDDDLIKLTRQWREEWDESQVKEQWETKYKENEDYWLGKQFEKVQADKDRANVDNVIFEAIETYIPQATQRNPEPIISLTNESDHENPTFEAFVEKVKERVVDVADKNKMRLKLKRGTRHWSLYLIGVAKFGWDLNKDIPLVRIIRPTRIILDPNAIIDDDGYSGGRIGEIRNMSASRLLAIIGDGRDGTSVAARKAISEITSKKEGTDIQFIEWWTPEYFCWTLGETVLLKRRNPHWNYGTEATEASIDEETGDTTPAQKAQPGINHLPVPDMPYRFLTVFNLGKQPMDETSLIGQNLANQDRINTRNKQIEKNVKRMNGGMVVSMERSGLSESQAKGVSDALRNGGVVLIPNGTPREAIDTYNPGPLPADVYVDRNDTRERLRSIFGVKGSSQAGLEDEKTVRGKIISRSLDGDRIGGGVSEYIEQFADDIYNWFVQLLYVYDDAFQFIPGAEPPPISVSVKEGSLLPKDSISIANQALDLAKMNRISTIDLMKRLEMPNPEELAANVWLEQNAPHILYKDNPMVQEALGIMAAQNEAQMAAEAQAQAPEGAPPQAPQGQPDIAMGPSGAESGDQRSLLGQIPQGPGP